MTPSGVYSSREASVSHVQRKHPKRLSPIFSEIASWKVNANGSSYAFICSRNSGLKFLNMAEALKQALRSAGFSWSNEALDLVVSHLLQEEIRELQALRGEKPAADTLPLRLLNFRLVARLRDRRLR